MHHNNIPQLLQNTLNSSLTRQAQQTLLNSRQNQGFITQLLIIGDDKSYNINVRQSALIHVKNALIDYFKQTLNLPKSDYQVVKSSILQALIRNCQQKSVTPTIRQIIFTLAQKQSPSHWEIIPEIANHIQNSGDFNQIYGSIEALKAIVSAFGKSVDQKITLFNLSNKIVLPLLSLASKLFQNYNQTTSVILISIFKIFSTITYFSIPEIILMNMHTWMIFIKKILDLNIQSGCIDKNMYQLKKICLRIIFRFYQRHMNKKNSNYSPNIILDFHQKYTKGIVQSLLLQIMNEAQLYKNAKHKRYLELTKFALSSLSHVYGEDHNAAVIIDKYRQKIIYLCLQRYRVKLNKTYSSFNQFSSKISEQRSHFCKFITSLIKNDSQRTQQNSNSSDSLARILSNLFDHMQKGDMQIKQICLYLFSNVADLLPEIDETIQTKMLTFILNYVKPLLKNQQTPTLVKLRCCETIARYSYVQIPQNQLTEFGEGVYGCLIANSNSPQPGGLNTFLQIHAVHAFNALLRYDFLINFTSPFLNNILQVYTSLLEIEVSIIKCLEDMLDKFQLYLQPFGQSLIEMLSNMYFKYIELMNQSHKNYSLKPNAYLPFKSNQNNQDEDEDEEQDTEDDEQNQDDIQNDYLTASKACLGAIRQIIQSPSFYLERDEIIHNILISVFTDKQQLFTEEGFNILNLVLFKQKQIKPEYNLYFILITNGILPLSKVLVETLIKQNSNYSKTLLNMLECICQNPDPDFIQNTIGCLRNFISKYQGNLRNQYDQTGKSFLNSLFEMSKYVHENIYEKESNLSATQSQRSVILTLYMSLIQYKALNQNQVTSILENVSAWMNMEKQSNPTQQTHKLIYCPIYLQIILLSVHFYPQVTLKLMNSNWIVTELLSNWDRFKCDYQIARVLIGVADLLNFGSLNDQTVSTTLMNILPQIIQKACNIRLNEDENDITSVDDQAEEDKLFGMDENTHIMGWKKQPIPQNNNQGGDMQDEDEGQSEDWEQFNQYYLSPFDNIDEIQYIFQILKRTNCSNYISLMATEAQAKLSQIIVNVPNKLNN